MEQIKQTSCRDVQPAVQDSVIPEGFLNLFLLHRSTGYQRKSDPSSDTVAAVPGWSVSLLTINDAEVQASTRPLQASAAARLHPPPGRTSFL